MNRKDAGMTRNRTRIASLLLMVLIIVVSLSVPAYAAVVVPPKVSPSATAPIAPAKPSQ